MRQSGDSRRGKGSRVALVVLSKDALHSAPSSEVQLLPAALRDCHVSVDADTQGFLAPRGP